MINNIVQLIRLKDWFKNLIIFLPLIFSGNLNNTSLYPVLFISFFLFCLTSSVIYIINDLKDIESDKFHFLKINKKPLASGLLSKQAAISILLFLLLLIGFILINFSIIIYHLMFYLIINVIYSFYIKKIPVLDVLLISSGYIVRLDAGSVTISVNTSILLAISIFSLACFIIFIKRLVEFKTNNKLREVFSYYNESIIKYLIIISSIIFFSTLILFIYLMKIELIILIPILMYLFKRYFNLAIKYNLGEFPFDLVFKDKKILILSIVTLFYLLFVYY